MKRNSRSGDSKSTTRGPISGSSLIKTGKKRVADGDLVYVNGVFFEPKRVKRELGRQAFQTTIEKEIEKVTSSKVPYQPVEVGSQSSNATQGILLKCQKVV